MSRILTRRLRLIETVFLRRGDAETGRRGDAETRRGGDAERRRGGDAEIGTFEVTASPLLRFSLSPRRNKNRVAKNYPFGIFIEYMIAANVSRCFSNLSPSVDTMIFSC